MATVLYRCPNTGFRVQGYTDERTPADHDGCVPVTCLACKFVHLVNPKSAEVVASLNRKAVDDMNRRDDASVPE
jgi:hypothetical protein